MRIAVAAYLAIWEPLTVASLAAASLPSMSFRGAAGAIELAWACAVAVCALGAAVVVWNRGPSAGAFARGAIVFVALRDLQALYWTYLPSDVVPGTREAIAAAIAGVNALVWLAASRLGPRD